MIRHPGLFIDRTRGRQPAVCSGVFGSLFAFAAGLLVIGSGGLPRWLGGISILVGILFFLQGFGLGGVIATFGLVLDGIGFVLLLIFVLVSSVLLLRRESAVPSTSGGD